MRSHTDVQAPGRAVYLRNTHRGYNRCTSIAQVKSIRCKYETVERQPNYLAAIHGDEEEARFIASNKAELLHTGYIFVSVTFDDESILLRTYYSREVAARQ